MRQARLDFIRSVSSVEKKVYVVIGGFRGGAEGLRPPFFQNVFVRPQLF